MRALARAAARDALAARTRRVCAGARLLAPLAHAMIDVSDGLVQDLGHVCARQRRRRRGRAPTACPWRRRAAARSAPRRRRFAATAGEDYELLLAVPPRRRAASRGSRRGSAAALTRIGDRRRGGVAGVRLLDARGRPLRARAARASTTSAGPCLRPADARLTLGRHGPRAPRRAARALVQRGACPVDEALERLRALPFEDLGFARVDHHRELRNGFPRGDLRPGQDARADRRDRRAAGRAAGGNVLVTRSTRTGGATLRRAPSPGFDVPPAARASRCARDRPVEPLADGTGARRRRRARPTCRWPRRPRSRPSSSATRSSACTTSASPASTACSPSASDSGQRGGADRRRGHGGRAAERGRRAGRSRR